MVYYTCDCIFITPATGFINYDDIVLKEIAGISERGNNAKNASNKALVIENC